MFYLVGDLLVNASETMILAVRGVNVRLGRFIYDKSSCNRIPDAAEGHSLSRLDKGQTE